MESIEVFKNTYRAMSQHNKNVLIKNIQLFIFKNELQIHKVLYDKNPICKYSHNLNFTMIDNYRDLLFVFSELSGLE